MTVSCREDSAPLGKAVLLPHFPILMPRSLITVSSALTGRSLGGRADPASAEWVSLLLTAARH